MKYTLTIIEQLDRAAHELSIDHPINNRLALILIDNATELILYRQCTGRLEWDNLFGPIHKAAQTITKSGTEAEEDDDLTVIIMRPDQRRKAREPYLKSKLQVLEEMGDLSTAERRFNAIAHKYRNELYHTGLKHDAIIRAIASQYFLFCCELFVRLDQLSPIVISSTDEYTDTARRYLPTYNGEIDFMSVERDELTDRLRRELPDGLPDLSTTLADRAHTNIAKLNEAFEFLVEDNPLGFDKKRMLEIAQWQHDLARALQEEDLIGIRVDDDYRASHAQIASDLEEHWKQRHTMIPTVAWTRRADAVGNETNPLKALDLYEALRNDMSYLEEAIISAAADLDHWIQMEIDIARGK